MPIDPSIPLQASPGSAQSGMNFKLGNPLEMAHQFAGIQNQVNQARQFEQLYKARNALGPILQSSVEQDPNSPSYGMIDVGKAMASASTNPDAAWLAPDYIKGALANQQTQLENNQKQLALGLDRTKLMSGIFARLQPLGDNITQQDILDAASDVHATGAVPAQDVASWLKRAGTGGPRSAQFIRTAATENAILNQHFETAFGKVEQALTGNSIQYNRVNAITGQVDKLGGSIPVRMSPAEAASQVTGPVTAAGAPTLITKGQLAEQSGQAPSETYSGGASAENPLPVSGDLGGAKPQFTAAAAPVQTALAPAALHAETKLGEAAGDYAKDLNERVHGQQQLMLRLKEMEPLLEKARTGGGSEARGALAKFAQAFNAPEGLVDKIAGGDLAATQELQKFFVQSSTEVLRSLLVGSRMTNLEFDQFMKNNPNLETDPRAIEKMLNFVTRAYNVDSTEQNELTQFRKRGGDLTQWPNEWNQKLRAEGTVNTTERSGYAQRPGATGASKEWVIKDGKLVPKTQ